MDVLWRRAGWVAVALAIGFSTPAAPQPPASPPPAQQSPQQQQSQQQPPRPVFRTGANVVRVDVTVTTHKGEPATELTRDDFVLEEDGRPQAIDSFQFVRSDGQPTDDRELEIRSPTHAAAEAARDDVRTFLIFWDEYHIGQFAPAIRGREALMEFVRTAFGPTDLVGIMDQLTTVDSIRFTRDRLALAEQVRALRGRFGVYIPARSAIEEGHMKYPNDMVRLRNEVTMTALASAAAFLGNFREGRKTLLFVSQGIPTYVNGNPNLYEDIVRTANTNNTAIYTLDPGAEVGRRPDSLLGLAYDTGGRPFVGTNRPAVMMPQMVRDASAYYLLGYSSPAPFDGKFHKIKVEVRKNGYEVRARSGYFTPTPGAMERGRKEAEAGALPPDVERALDQLATRSDRAIEVWLGMARGAPGRTRVTLAWKPGGAATKGTMAVSVRASGAADGATFADVTRTTDRGIVFEVPPGQVKLTTRALDAQGNEVDVDVRTITVPGYPDEQLAIGTPVVQRARTPRDVKTLVDGGELAPEVGREFERSDRLFIRFPLYGGADAVASAQLLNRQGALVRELTVEAAGAGAYRIDVPLNASARGDYLVAITGKRGDASVRSLVPLRVK
jgi:VWFA-related protein